MTALNIDIFLQLTDQYTACRTMSVRSKWERGLVLSGVRGEGTRPSRALAIELPGDRKAPSLCNGERLRVPGHITSPL